MVEVKQTIKLWQAKDLDSGEIKVFLLIFSEKDLLKVVKDVGLQTLDI